MPSARLISSGLRTLYKPYTYETTENLPNDFLMFSASVVVQDISKTLKSQTADDNYGFECCECDGRKKISQRFFNRNCMPIEIPAKDKVFRGQKCMNYIRSMVTHDNCDIKEAQVVRFPFISSNGFTLIFLCSSTQRPIILTWDSFMFHKQSK